MNFTVENIVENVTDKMENGEMGFKGFDFGTVDYCVFLVMLALSLSIGVYFAFFGNASTSTEEYLLGGRKMKTLPIAVSLIASQISGISIMAFPAEMYVYGTQLSMIVVFMTVCVLTINYIFIPVFYNNHIANCYEYLELRFSKAIKNMITFLFILKIILVLPVTLFIPALAFAQVTNVNLHLVNTVVSTICVFYTMMGGIKAVVWTDVVQAGIMLTSCVIVFFMGVSNVGGIDEVLRIADEGERLEFFNMTLDLTSRQTFWNTSIGFTMMWTCYLGLNQSCVQRIVSVPSITHARRALMIFCVGFYIIVGLNCFIGVVMYAKYAGCDPLETGHVSKPDKMVPYFVQDVVGHFQGMTGVFVSCVFSAGLSTMSANLNSLAGVLYEDYIRKHVKHTELKANRIMKLTIVLIGVYCIFMGFFVEKFSSILQMVMTVTSVSNGTTLGVFCLGMLWPWANKKGAFWGTVISAACVVTLVVGSQIKIQNGEINYPTLPTSTDQCEARGIFFNSTTPANTTTTFPPEDDEFSLFKISFPWFPVISFILVWLVGVPVSYMTGGYDLSLTGTKLLTPAVHKLVPQEIRDRELKAMEMQPQNEADAHWTWSSPEENEEDKLKV